VGQNLPATAEAAACGSWLELQMAATSSTRLADGKWIEMLRAWLDSMRPHTVLAEVEVARLSSCGKLAVR
jgi:hypothetical protein